MILRKLEKMNSQSVQSQRLSGSFPAISATAALSGWSKTAPAPLSTGFTVPPAKNISRAASRPSARFLEREAYAWANREILTLEQAEDYIRGRRERHSDLGRIRDALHLSALSPTQEKDVNVWLEQGFGEEAIAIAADRTVTNTGSLKWSYLSKILQSWHQKGLHSPAEIA